MKKLALGLVFAVISTGVFAQEETAGGASTGAGVAGGTATISTTAVLVGAGVVAAAAVVAGATTDPTTSHK